MQQRESLKPLATIELTLIWPQVKLHNQINFYQWLVGAKDTTYFTKHQQNVAFITYMTDTASTSINAPLGSADTSTTERAG